MLNLSIIPVTNLFVKLLDPHCSEESINVKFKMPITSSTTSSRDRDVPSAEVIFRDKLCLVSITRRDDTPMGASSISEEDVIEICIMKGHTHPLGVLHYSAMELVVLFHSLDELQCTTCRIIRTTEFRGEAITVRAMAPLEAHVTVYIVMLCTHPSNREREPHTPPQQTPPSGEHCITSKQNLETLLTMSCISLWKTSCRKLQCEIHVPPSNPPPNKWICPLGSREPKEDDQEVTFPGGGRWGPPRQPTPPAEPEQPAGGRVPSGPPL